MKTKMKKKNYKLGLNCENRNNETFIKVLSKK